MRLLADDFEIDTDDGVLVNVLGINLNGKEFKHSYSAGHDAVLNVKGGKIVLFPLGALYRQEVFSPSRVVGH